MGFSAASLGQMSLIGQVGGAVTSAMGAQSAAASQKSSLSAQAALNATNARIAETNARVMELGAQGALLAGQSQVARLTHQAGNLKASQRVGQAANGLSLGEGSAAEVRASTDIMKEIDANTLTANAISNAWGYRTQAVNARTQAVNASNASLMSSASASGLSPTSSAVTSLIGSAGRVSSSWYSLNKSGALDKPSEDPLGDFGTQLGIW